MPYIKNHAGYDLESNGFRVEPNTALIQLLDIGIPYIPKTDYSVFADVSQFYFLDLDEGDDGFNEYGITKPQAGLLVRTLESHLEKGYNIIVHCTAGINRSGAVTEFGIRHLGFDDTGVHRGANQTVLKYLEEVSGSRKDQDYYNSLVINNENV